MNIKKTKKSMNLMPYIVLTIVVIGSYIFLNSFSTKINKITKNKKISFSIIFIYFF